MLLLLRKLLQLLLHMHVKLHVFFKGILNLNLRENGCRSEKSQNLLRADGWKTQENFFLSWQDPLSHELEGSWLMFLLLDR